MQNHELPSYSRRSRPTDPRRTSIGTTASFISEHFEHSFPLERNGRRWMTLFVRSRARSAASPPAYLEGDTVSGRVELDLDRPEVIKGITVTIQGGTTAVGQEELLFLDMTQSIWSPEDKSSEKLSGKHSWPFSFALPTEVTVPLSKGRSASFKLPPNFSERASPSYIDYKFIVTVKRGTFKANQTLSPYFAYVPSLSPPRPSAMRQMAYRNGSELAGPDRDPEGWKVIGPAKIKGVLFQARSAEVDCTLAIAKPLCYSVKSPIPLFLTLVSSDQQALDVLASPSAIRLWLVRSLATGSDAVDEDVVRRSNNFFVESAGQAVFWPAGGDANSRTLQGELDVKQGIKPSFVFPRLTVRYTLDLLPFEAPGFVAPLPADNPVLLSEKVTIVTRQAAGVVPRSYAPPGYEQPQGGDYNKSMGLLENGNQRFYHHFR